MGLPMASNSGLQLSLMKVAVFTCYIHLSNELKYYESQETLCLWGFSFLIRV